MRKLRSFSKKDPEMDKNISITAPLSKLNDNQFGFGAFKGNDQAGNMNRQYSNLSSFKPYQSSGIPDKFTNSSYNAFTGTPMNHNFSLNQNTFKGFNN